MCVQVGLCQTWSETTLLVFPRGGSSIYYYIIAGYVIFENITEDQYTIYAQADGHSSFSEIILANPAETARDIFLQRVAVKYTWTVTPTTVEDKYIITLDSTFETYVRIYMQYFKSDCFNTIVTMKHTVYSECSYISSHLENR